MLTILVGTDQIAIRDRILQRISLDVKEKAGNRILLVPELISHDMERRLSQTAGDTSSRFAQVLSFTRLARVVSETTGQAPLPCLDNGGRVVAMAAAVRQLNNVLKSYASVQTRPEFLTGLLDAVDEFKRCCVSSEDLRIAAKKTAGVFAQKLQELSLIMDAYDGITSGGKRDPRDQMTWLLEQMEACDFAHDHVFYIDGFPDFTRQHSAILEHLILNSSNVIIGFNCDHAGSKAMAFEKAGRSAMDVISFAKANQVPYKVEVVEGTDSVLSQMRLRLYQGSTAQIPQLDQQLKLVSAGSVYAECRNAAMRIMQLVRNGCRYRDIGVVCSDIGAYENAVQLVFGKSHIPFYRSGTDDVLQKNVLNGLFAAIHAALDGFDRQYVLRYMKSMLSVLDQETCDRVENYAILWAINGTLWTKSWENHPRGLGEKWKEQDEAELAHLNDARAQLIDPLEKLRLAFRDASNLADQVKAVADFFAHIRLAGRLSELADYMDENGDNRSAQILDQLWEILLSALEQLHDVLGNSTWDQDSFCRLLMLLLSQYDVGTIPTVLDSVVVGGVSAMRCHQVRHLIVMGVSEGALPGFTGTVGVLTDREREELRKLNVPLTGGGMEGLQSEFAEIYGVFSCATDSVCVSFSTGQSSFLFNRLSSMAGGHSEYEDSPAAVISDSVEAASYLAAFGAGRAARELGITEEYDALCERATYTYGAISTEHIRGLYGDKLNLSASQVDKQANCRFSYFLRYGLHAKELKEASVDPAQFGTYFHAVLENTARRVMELGGFHKVSLEDTVKLALEYSEAYITENFGQLDSSRMTYLFSRNVEELKFLIKELWQELSVSLFEPTLFEVGFGEHEELAAVSIPNTAIPAQLGGFVDRVDQWNDGYNNYFRVVDYKSGKKSFDYCDVFNGMGLQMLLYMYALEQQGDKLMGEHPIPVGVQYFAARFPFENKPGKLEEVQAELDRGKEMKRKGLILQDDAVWNAMQPEGAPQRLCVKYSKSGEPTGDCADREQFRKLRKYVFHILRKLVDQIASGDVTPNPYTRGMYGACSYCPYGAVCHKNSVPGRRDYKTMEAKRFWEEIDREVAKHG